MKELIEQIKLKVDIIPTNTKENRRVKGAYVDCLMMLKEASKNLALAPVSGSLPPEDDAYQRLDDGRYYLMGVEPADLTVEDALEAFGFGRNGLRQ